MWLKSECIGHKPEEIDNTSSGAYVYVRKNFEESQTEEGEVKYTYLEQKIKKEDWEVYKQCLENTNDITDLQLALVEVYEQIGG